MVATKPEVGTSGVEEDGVGAYKCNLGDAIAIQILRAPIVASWIQIAEHGNGDRRRLPEPMTC